jgi:hypothetical protein
LSQKPQVLLLELHKTPNVRNGTVLKARWLKTRSTFTTARKSYVNSGQQNNDNFSSFVGPDKPSHEARTAMYCAAAFHRQPSLGEVAKVIPENSVAEEGVEGSSTMGGRDRDASSRGCAAIAKKKIRRGDSVPEIVAALTPVAEALSQPVHVKISESSPKRTKSSNASDRMERYALATDFASTVTKLMELECTIEVQNPSSC